MNACHQKKNTDLFFENASAFEIQEKYMALKFFEILELGQ